MKILLIKLGALGDVIRTTPLLRKLKSVYPESQIYWLSRFDWILPEKWVHRRLKFELEHILWLLNVNFDLLVNLDKDQEAISLASKINALRKNGFIIENGNCAPADDNAQHKFLTGIFDSLSKDNKKSYLEEIFEICGFTFCGEKYILPDYENANFKWKNRTGKERIVGLNTGCGERWTSRRWPDEHWIELAKKLIEHGYGVLFLGGESEHQKNQKMAKMAGAYYPGTYPIKEFINVMNQCELIVTSVTMALHIAIGLSRKIVLFNNIFNRNEFELYGLGEILEPPEPCDCYYAKVCPNECMKTITVQRTLESCLNLLKRENKG